MDSRYNATLTFGLVTVPVGIAPAVSEKAEPTFKTLHAECSTPIKKKIVGGKKVETPVTGQGSAVDWCETCNCEALDQIKGFEFAKDQFLIFNAEEAAAMKSDNDPYIRVEKFIPRTSVNPVAVASYHYLIPNQYEAPKYGLVYQTLASKKLAAFGHQCLWGKDHPCVVVADQSFGTGVLMMLSLHPYEDLVQPDFTAPIPDKTLRTMTNQIVDMLAGTLDPVKDLVSSSRKRKTDAIAAKMKGKAVKATKATADPKVGDMMQELKDSLALLQKKPARKATPKKVG